MAKTKNKNWKNSIYGQKVRIKDKDLFWLKENKSNASAAEFLSYVIKFYKKNK